MNSLPPSLKQLRITKEQIEAERCRRSFYYFVRTFWPVIISDEFIDNWHIKYLCDIIQQAFTLVFNKQPNNGDIICNIPPGTSKSTLFTVMAPAWSWTNDPRLIIITGSYSADLSTFHSVKSRDIIKSDLYRSYWPGIKLKPDMDNKTHYGNTRGGARISTSVGGTITGKHAHIIIIDDPINPQQATSDADRETANKWIRETLPSRKVDKLVTLTGLVMQRLHTQDPTNMLLQLDPNIQHICLPARKSSNIHPAELAAYYTDDLLDPIRLGNDALSKLEQRLGSYGSAGQLQQRPAPIEGAIWGKWFIPVPDAEFPPPDKLQNYGTDWDTAYTANEMNDATAYCTSGMQQDSNGKRIYLDRVGYKRAEFPEMIRYIALRPKPHHIEAKASGKSAKQTLVRNGIPAIEVKVEGGDKIARTRFATPYAEAGIVYVRASQLDMIYNDAEQGILNFPNGANDDLNDAIVQAIQRHSKQRSWII